MQPFWLYQIWIWFLSKSNHTSEEPSQWFPFFYQPDWCGYVLHFPMPTLLWCCDCPFLSPGTAFFCFHFWIMLVLYICREDFFLDHACSLCLLWGLLLGWYLKGMTFKCSPSDYTKTEYGFWANPTIPLRNPANDSLFYQPDWCGYVHHFPMPTLLWCCDCLFFIFAVRTYFWIMLLFMFAVRTPIRTVS